VYERRPGWSRFLVRLAVSCVAMVGVLLALLYWLPAFSPMGLWQRIGALSLLVGAGGATYLLVQVALGLRPRDLRGH